MLAHAAELNNVSLENKKDGMDLTCNPWKALVANLRPVVV